MIPLANEGFEKTTYRLLLAALHSFRRDDHLPVIILCRKGPFAQFELETLFSQ